MYESLVSPVLPKEKKLYNCDRLPISVHPSRANFEFFYNEIVCSPENESVLKSREQRRWIFTLFFLDSGGRSETGKCVLMTLGEAMLSKYGIMFPGFWKCLSASSMVSKGRTSFDRSGSPPGGNMQSHLCIDAKQLKTSFEIEINHIIYVLTKRVKLAMLDFCKYIHSLRKTTHS